LAGETFSYHPHSHPLPQSSRLQRSTVAHSTTSQICHWYRVGMRQAPRYFPKLAPTQTTSENTHKRHASLAHISHSWRFYPVAEGALTGPMMSSCDSELDNFDTLCDMYDEQLFNSILHQPDDVSYPLLPPQNISKYNLHNRPHNRKLSQRASRLTAILLLEWFIMTCIDFFLSYFHCNISSM